MTSAPRPESHIGMRKHIAYGALSCLFLLSFGPFNSTLSEYQLGWHTLVLLAIACWLIGVWFAVARIETRGQIGRVLIVLSAGYAALIMVVFAMHLIALTNMPVTAKLNVAGISASEWIRENRRFATFYLYFPVLLILQYLLLRTIEFRQVARVLAMVAVLSIGVIYYQGLVDSAFLNHWQPWTGRVGGLATDPNAFALTAFLLIPMLIVALVLEREPGWRVFLFIVATLTLGGMIFAANRTAAGGIVLLVIVSPAIVAVARRNCKRRLRIGLFVAPFLIALGIIAMMNFMGENLENYGLLGKRLAATWEKIAAEGLGAILFQNEARGALWGIGWALLWKAPLGGWGPGGFYREYPNELFRQTGEIHSAFDSVLNHYLMIAGDLGLTALALNLLLIVIPMVLGVRSLWRTEDSRQRIVIAILVGTNIVFMLLISTIPPAYFPDVLWLWTAQLALLIVSAERTGITRMIYIPATQCRALTGVVAVALFVMVTVGAYQTSIGANGYRARLYAGWWPYRVDRNCYHVEHWPEGKGRWCGEDARLQLRIDPQQTGTLRIQLRAGNPDIAKHPLTVWYGGKEGARTELTISDHQWKDVIVPLDSEHVLEAQGKMTDETEKLVILFLKVSRTWVPKEWGINNDQRELGVAVLLP
jgi:O-antigen ligase